MLVFTKCQFANKKASACAHGTYANRNIPKSYVAKLANTLKWTRGKPDFTSIHYITLFSYFILGKSSVQVPIELKWDTNFDAWISEISYIL